VPPGPLSGDEDAEARLARLERRVAAQAAALARVPLNMRAPRSVIALLATAPAELDAMRLPPRCLPRLVALLDQVQALIDNVTLRKRELGGRLATVRAARRAGPAAHVLDCRS
jgi:hypothetical protein